MNNVWLKRFGAATGAIYILIALLHSGDDGPGFHATRQQILAWIHTSGTINSGRYVMVLLELLGLLCFLVFAGYVSTVLRRAEGDVAFLSTTVVSAGTLSVALKLASFPGLVAAYVWAHDGVDPRILGMLWDMGGVSMVLSLAADGLLVAAAAAVIISTGVLPRWLGWGAALTSVALFANVVLNRGEGFVPAMLLFMLWILVSSIVLIRRAGETDAPASATVLGEPALAR